MSLAYLVVNGPAAPLATRSCPRRGAQTQVRGPESHEATVPHLAPRPVSSQPQARPADALGSGHGAVGPVNRHRECSDMSAPVSPRSSLSCVVGNYPGSVTPNLTGPGVQRGWEPRAVSLGPSRPGLSWNPKAQVAEHSTVPPAGRPARQPSALLVAPGSRFRMVSNCCDFNHVSGVEYLPSQKPHEL